MDKQLNFLLILHILMTLRLDTSVSFAHRPVSHVLH